MLCAKILNLTLSNDRLNYKLLKDFIFRLEYTKNKYIEEQYWLAVLKMTL